MAKTSIVLPRRRLQKAGKNSKSTRNRVQQLDGAGRKGPSGGTRTRSKDGASVKTAGRKKADQGKELSPRELQVLKMTVDELAAREIAKKLKIGTRTVESHRASLMRKIGVTSIVGMTRYAIRQGIVQA